MVAHTSASSPTAGDDEACDLSPAHYMVERPSPLSVITWVLTAVLTLPQAQAHLLAFQLAAAFEMVTQWTLATSPLVTPEALLTFRHLRACLFDVLVPVRLAAGGQAAESLLANLHVDIGPSRAGESEH